MAEFVKKELYDSLIKERTKLIEVLEDSRSLSKKLDQVIKDDENFLSNYEDTKSNIENAISNIEKQKDSFEAEMDSNKESEKKLEEEIAALKDEVKELSERIEKLTKEGDPENEIPSLQKELNSKESLISSKSLARESLNKRNEKLNDLITDGDVSKTEYIQQLSENAERKDDLEGGTLDEQKLNLQDVNADIAKKEEEYSDFIAANNPTIKTYEAQADVRSRVITASNSRNAYNRTLPKEQNDIIASEFEVINSVIDVELSAEGPEEKELRDAAIDKGKSEAINPDFLSRDEAAELTRAALFSTKRVASLIKDAAMRGFSSVTVDDLSNSEIYALNNAGYVVVTTASESNLMIMWSNVEKESKE